MGQDPSLHNQAVGRGLRQAGVLKSSTHQVGESSSRGSALFSGFSAMGIAGWVTLTGSDPAMLSCKPCSSFCSLDSWAAFG